MKKTDTGSMIFLARGTDLTDLTSIHLVWLGSGSAWTWVFTLFIHFNERQRFQAKFLTDAPSCHPQVTLAVSSTGLCLNLMDRSSTVPSSL